MSEYPLISVIIPVYNASKYLHRCIDSILVQDYPQIELVLIDDGSSDESPIICDKYASEYVNVIVEHISNVGASLARKKGINLAKGVYLTFIDSDDYVAVNYVSAMYKAIRYYDTQVAGCGVQIVAVDDKIQRESQPQTYLLEGEMLMSRFFNYEFWGMCGGLYEADIFQQLIFPKATLSEDYFIKTQLFLYDCRMAYVDAPLYIYEKHIGSLSKTPLSVRAFEEFENVSSVYDLIKVEAPIYTSLAFKNVVETSVKLLLMGTAKERMQYKTLYHPISALLKNTTGEICNNPYLLKKIKMVALILRFFPAMSGVFNWILR